MIVRYSKIERNSRVSGIRGSHENRQARHGKTCKTKKQHRKVMGFLGVRQKFMNVRKHITRRTIGTHLEQAGNVVGFPGMCTTIMNMGNMGIE